LCGGLRVVDGGDWARRRSFVALLLRMTAKGGLAGEVVVVVTALETVRRVV
jgi:hypothetical protein